MSEVANVLDELRWIHEGDAWHGAALKESLSGVTAEQAAAWRAMAVPSRTSR